MLLSVLTCYGARANTSGISIGIQSHLQILRVKYRIFFVTVSVRVLCMCLDMHTQAAALIGDFNGWKESWMTKDKWGVWEITLPDGKH